VQKLLTKSKNSCFKVSKYHLKVKQCKQIPSKNEKCKQIPSKKIISAEKEVSRIFQYKQEVSKIPTRNSAKHLK